MAGSKVYMVIEIKIRDTETYSHYVEKAYGIVCHYGGRYRVRGGRVTPMFGAWS